MTLQQSLDELSVGGWRAVLWIEGAPGFTMYSPVTGYLEAPNGELLMGLLGEVFQTPDEAIVEMQKRKASA